MNIEKKIIINYWGRSQNSVLILDKQEVDSLMNSNKFQLFKEYDTESKVFISTDTTIEQVLRTNPSYKVAGIIYNSLEDYRFFSIKQNVLVLFDNDRKIHMLVQFYDKNDTEKMLQELHLTENQTIIRRNFKLFFCSERKSYLAVKYDRGQIDYSVEYQSLDDFYLLDDDYNNVP